MMNKNHNDSILRIVNTATNILYHKKAEHKPPEDCQGPGNPGTPKHNAATANLDNSRPSLDIIHPSAEQNVLNNNTARAAKTNAPINILPLI